MSSREFFSKRKLKDKELIKATLNSFKVSKEDILIIYDVNGWLNKENQSIVIEYNGLLDEEDTDEYIGYHYYDIYFYKDDLLNKLKNLENEFNNEVKVVL